MSFLQDQAANQADSLDIESPALLSNMAQKAVAEGA